MIAEVDTNTTMEAAPEGSGIRFEIHREGVTRLTSLRNAGGDWRWELLNDAGRVIAHGAGYHSKAACMAVVTALKTTCAETPIIDRA